MEAKLSHLVPILPVTDIGETLKFYAETLGFPSTWSWEDPPSMARVQRDDLSILFTLDVKRARQSAGMDIMIFLLGINALYEEMQARRVRFAAKMEDKPWGVREFAVRDNTGYFLRFAQSLELIESK